MIERITDNWRQLLAIVVYLLGFWNGYDYGYSAAKKEYSAQVQTDTKTLENHAQEIKIIRNEPDSISINRFRKNFGTDSISYNLGDKKSKRN